MNSSAYIVDYAVNSKNSYYNYDILNQLNNYTANNTYHQLYNESVEVHKMVPNDNSDTNKTFLDRSNRKSLTPGVLYHSKNCGDYEYIEEAGYKYYDNGVRKRLVKIRFVNIGYEATVPFTNAYNGTVKDPFKITVHGVGYVGNITSDEYTKDEYDMWYHMLSRCYNPKDKSYNRYGSVGVRVAERWFSLENFIHDLPTLPGYNEMKFGYKNRSKFALDKDYLQHGKPDNEKYYGPDTCIVVAAYDNSRFAAIDHKENTSSKHVGIHKLADNKYQSRIMVNKKDIFLGTYDNEIAAANMYNHVFGNIDSIDHDKIFNDVPYMSVKECLKHKLGSYPINIPRNVSLPEIEAYNHNIYNKKNYHKNKNKKQDRNYIAVKTNVISFTNTENNIAPDKDTKQSEDTQPSEAANNINDTDNQDIETKPKLQMYHLIPDISKPSKMNMNIRNVLRYGTTFL